MEMAAQRSEDDGLAIQEIMRRLNIPGMRDSVREGLAAPIADGKEERGG